MKTKLQVGAEIDFVTAGEIKDLLVEQDERRKRAAYLKRPFVRDVEGFGVVGADQTVTIRMTPPAPATGRQWDVRRISICGNDPTAALTGTATIFRRGIENPLNFVDRIASLPGKFTSGADVLTLSTDEVLIVRITGGTAGDNVFVSAQVMDGPWDQLYEVGEQTEGDVVEMIR